MRKTTDYLPALIERIGAQRPKRMIGILLALPTIVVVIIVGIYFVVWRTDPLIRFTHMIWVLGFWMVGTVATFIFLILARLKLGLPIPMLIFAFIVISLAIHFTPLSRFITVFPSQTGLILPAVIGGLSVTTSWLFVLRFRKKIVDA